MTDINLNATDLQVLYTAQVAYNDDLKEHTEAAAGWRSAHALNDPDYIMDTSVCIRLDRLGLLDSHAAKNHTFRINAKGRQLIASIVSPFQGETMVCALCSKTQVSDPAVSSGWRRVEYGETVFYICPKHFPGEKGTESEFKQAWAHVLRSIASRSSRGKI